jgi:hypothetical protein
MYIIRTQAIGSCALGTENVWTPENKTGELPPHFFDKLEHCLDAGGDSGKVRLDFQDRETDIGGNHRLFNVLAWLARNIRVVSLQVVSEPSDAAWMSP